MRQHGTRPHVSAASGSRGGQKLRRTTFERPLNATAGAEHLFPAFLPSTNLLLECWRCHTAATPPPTPLPHCRHYTTAETTPPPPPGAPATANDRHSPPRLPPPQMADGLINPLTATGPLARWRPPPMPAKVETQEDKPFFSRSIWGTVNTHLGELPPSRKHHRLSRTRAPGEEFDA